MLPGPMADATEAEGDLRIEIDGLRRRLDDHGGFLRKNQQALAELAESLGRMVNQQRRRDRWANANSFVAYILFTLVLGGAFLTLYRSRAAELEDRSRTAIAERDGARARAATLEADLAARQQATEKAYGFYQLLESGKRDDALARYAELDPNQLTPVERDVLARAYQKAREDLVDAGYLSALDAARAGDHAKTIQELRRALAYQDEGPRTAQMRYLLGVALVKTNDADKGRRELELALAGRVEQSGAVDARYWLASAFERLGQVAEARTEFDRFASAHVRHPLAMTARRKSMMLARRATAAN